MRLGVCPTTVVAEPGTSPGKPWMMFRLSQARALRLSGRLRNQQPMVLDETREMKMASTVRSSAGGYVRGHGGIVYENDVMEIETDDFDDETAATGLTTEVLREAAESLGDHPLSGTERAASRTTS